MQSIIKKSNINTLKPKNTISDFWRFTYAILLRLGLGTNLIIKVPRPGDSKGTFLVFESSCHLLLPV